MDNHYDRILEKELLTRLQKCDEQEALYLNVAALAQELVTYAQQQRSYLHHQLSRLHEVQRRYSRTSLPVPMSCLDAEHEE